MATETHDPRPGEHYEVTPQKQMTDFDVYKIVGQMRTKSIDGVLTIYNDDGEFNGYDWTGTELTDDEQQELLDLFADK